MCIRDRSIADLGNKIHCAPSNAMAKGAFSDASAMLMNGQVAMVIDGGWALANYTNEGFDVGLSLIHIWLSFMRCLPERAAWIWECI